MSDPKHPIWAIVKLVVVLGWATGVLYMTASDFDITEIRALLAMALGWVGAEGADMVKAKVVK